MKNEEREKGGGIIGFVVHIRLGSDNDNFGFFNNVIVVNMLKFYYLIK